MKLGTDFSGIGSPESALKRLGLEVDEVFACEIDKYARKSFIELHNPTTFYNDITTRNHSEVPQLDLYVAGFPCQSFSLAGKRGGFEDTRGTLFFNVAEFIKENQPKCFILENVKGLLSHDSGRTYQTITDVLTNGGGTLNGQIGLDSIDNGLGYHVYAKVLNSKDYGIPQNRERIFLVGFKEFREFRFPKKMELKLRLKNLLQDNTENKYNLSNKAVAKIERHNNKSLENDISNTIHAGYYKQGGRDQQYIPVDKKYYLSEKMIKTITTPSGGDWNSGKMSFNTDIAKCIRANTHKMGRADTDNYITETNNKRVNNCFNKHKEVLEDGDFMDSYNQSIHKEVMPTMTCKIASSSNYHIYKEVISHSLFPRTSKTGKGGSGHLSKIDGPSYCVDTECSQGVEVNKRIRRLTPLECWRLQGYTDEQFYAAQKVNSDTQLYKQAGNSITVNVMVELFKKIYNKL